MAVHSEDEARLKERAKLAMPGDPRTPSGLARRRNRAPIHRARPEARARAPDGALHILHASTAEELPLLADARDIATVETPCRT